MVRGIDLRQIGQKIRPIYSRGECWQTQGYLLWCLLQRRESCRGYPPWWVVGSTWEQNSGRRVRWSVHQDYDYIATMPGMVHRYRYLPQLRRFPGMSTLVAARPHWSPPSPESALPVLRLATSPNMPAIFNPVNPLSRSYLDPISILSYATSIVLETLKSSQQTINVDLDY